MKNSIIASLLCAFVLFSCGENNDLIIAPNLDSSSKILQVALYNSPDVYEEGFNHHTQTIEQIKLDYNRQVFVDLDAASSTSNADTLGVHYSDADFVKLDVWDVEKDNAQGIDGWDLVLANYNGKTDDGTGTLVPYRLTGALINKGKVTAIRLNKAALENNGDTYVSYDEISYDIANTITLSADVDAIGSDWKVLDFATFTYKMVEEQYYIIKTTEGVLFKLAFTGFYNDDLDKGHPSFKFQRILEVE